MTEVLIDSIGQHGDGIAEIGGERVFVPFTLPGERVEIAREGERGTLLRIIAPSAERAEPISPYFGACGGCSLQHMNRASYAAFKRGLVVTALAHAEVETVVQPLIDATGAGRRRATLHVRKTGAGYMRAKSHEVLDIDACPILVPTLSKHAPRIARALQPLAGDCDVSFTLSDTGIDLSIRSERKLKPVALAEFARAQKLARLTFNGDAVYMARPPAIKMGKALVEIPPASFLQATAAAEETLARLVSEGVGKVKAVADLFSGVGPFTLRLAEGARVFAADSDRPGIAALVKGARPVPRPAGADRAEPVRCRGVRSAAGRRRSAGQGAGAEHREDRRRGIVRTEDVCTRCGDPDRRWVSAGKRGAGGSVRILDACRGGRGVSAVSHSL